MNENKKILEPFDWRYSAVIVGMIRYLERLYPEKKLVDIEECKNCEKESWSYSSEELCYDERLLSEDKYLEYAEKEYEDDMHHRQIEIMLENGDITDEESIKAINKKLVANTIMKKSFKGIKYPKDSRIEILKRIDDNRKLIVLNTFKNKNNLYKNYCNENMFFRDEKESSRLKGYYVDMGKKGKSQGYNFNKSNFTGEDNRLFDFVAFAFSGDREFYFVNDNIDLNLLVKTNNIVKQALIDEKNIQYDEKKQKINGRRVFFKSLMSSIDYMDNNVEVIYKNTEEDFFRTVFIRRESIKIFRKLKKSEKDYNNIVYYFGKQKVNDNYYLDSLDIVMKSIINGILLDNLIDFFLKKNTRNIKKYDVGTIRKLIDINTWIKEDDSMNDKLKKAYGDAKRIVDNKNIMDNKIASYRQKLISALVLEDYDQFNKILLNLSNYAGVQINSAYDLFEDFEENKEVAYTFVNTLYRNNKKTEEA